MHPSTTPKQSGKGGKGNQRTCQQLDTACWHIYTGVVTWRCACSTPRDARHFVTYASLQACCSHETAKKKYMTKGESSATRGRRIRHERTRRRDRFTGHRSNRLGLIGGTQPQAFTRRPRGVLSNNINQSKLLHRSNNWRLPNTLHLRGRDQRRNLLQPGIQINHRLREQISLLNIVIQKHSRSGPTTKLQDALNRCARLVIGGGAKTPTIVRFEVARCKTAHIQVENLRVEGGGGKLRVHRKQKGAIRRPLGEKRRDKRYPLRRDLKAHQRHMGAALLQSNRHEQKTVSSQVTILSLHGNDGLGAVRPHQKHNSHNNMRTLQPGHSRWGRSDKR